MKILRCTAAALAAALLIMGAGGAGGAGPARASDATDFVRETVDMVLGVIDDPALQGPENERERRDRVEVYIRERFDFVGFSRLALGRHWGPRTAEEREEFVDVFTQCALLFYLDQIESRTIKRIDYNGEVLRGEGRFAEVSTYVLTRRGEDFRILYRLRKSDGGWAIIDVVVDGVSLIRNFRTQFYEILEDSTFEELIALLRSKIE